MTGASRHDAWGAGQAYDAYMGRWSAAVAPRFVSWLGVPAGGDWLDVGCGTGTLVQAALREGAASRVTGVDPADGFLGAARARIADPRADFLVGSAEALPVPAGSRDAVVSGLVLNFVPDPVAALSAMRAAARPGGRVGFYVWDYPAGMGFLSAFWDAAVALDPAAEPLAESRRFGWCAPGAMRASAEAAGLEAIEDTAFEVATEFADFDDFWRPFTLGAGPAPGYCAGLDGEARERLRASLEASVPRTATGTIPLAARALAVRGRA